MEAQQRQKQQHQHGWANSNQINSMAVDVIFHG